MNLLQNCCVIKSFPNFDKSGFDMYTYNSQFKTANVIIHASSKEVSYPEHWGPLSIKCAFKGKEFYRVNNCNYAVADENYLVINDGNHYSSYIDSIAEVESFTINFSQSFVKEFMESANETDEALLANFRNFDNNNNVEIIERLYLHDDSVGPVIFRMLQLTEEDFDGNEGQIEELYFLLLERLLHKQKATLNEVSRIQAVKKSTQIELYKRLYRAKDYIDSCYEEEITIQHLATVCWLNQSYFLRQFKKYFRISPLQYIISKRMEAAKRMLEKDAFMPISEVCTQVGYSDISSFSKLFKGFYNSSPEKFRMLHHNKIVNPV